MKIGENQIGDGKPVYIIAEAGINHNGNLELAKEMIEAAAKCNANAVKFQSFTPEEVFSKNGPKFRCSEGLFPVCILLFSKSLITPATGSKV